MLDRLKVRHEDLNEDLALEMIKTASDRILLRVGMMDEELPKELESICVEVVSSMLNRNQMNHEGVDSESVDVFSIKFVNDLLKQYDDEFMNFRNIKEDEENSFRDVVRFL